MGIYASRDAMLRRLVYAVLALVLLAATAGLPALADGTKKLSGKVRSVEGNIIVVKKSGLIGTSEVQIEMTDETKRKGQIAAGMHVKVKYREEKAADGETRRIAVEIEARPEYASKKARELAKEPAPEPQP